MVRLLVVALALTAIVFSLGVREAHALIQVAPLSFKFSGSQRTGSFTVFNHSPNDNRIEFTVVEEIGDQERDAADDFVIFPPLTVLKRDGSQVVRFQYVGEPSGAERKFYIYVNELTPQLMRQEMQGGSAAAEINLLVRIGVLVTIAP